MYKKTTCSELGCTKSPVIFGHSKQNPEEIEVAYCIDHGLPMVRLDALKTFNGEPHV